MSTLSDAAPEPDLQQGSGETFDGSAKSIIKDINQTGVERMHLV